MATQRASAEVDRTLVLLQDRVAASSGAQVSTLTGSRGVLHLNLNGYEIYCLDDTAGVLKKFTAGGRGSGSITSCTQAGIGVGYTGVSAGSAVTSGDLVVTTWQAELLQAGTQGLVKVTLGMRSAGEVRVSRPVTPVVGSAVASVGRDSGSYSATSTATGTSTSTSTSSSTTSGSLVSGVGVSSAGTTLQQPGEPEQPEEPTGVSGGSISSGIRQQQLD